MHGDFKLKKSLLTLKYKDRWTGCPCRAKQQVDFTPLFLPSSTYHWLLGKGEAIQCS